MSLSKKTQAAIENARAVFTKEWFDKRLAGATKANAAVVMFDNWTQEQKEAFNACMATLPKSASRSYVKMLAQIAGE